MRLLSSIAVMAATIGLADALTIESKPSGQAPEKLVGDRTPLARSWSISGSEPLTKLEFAVPGRIIVSYEAAEEIQPDADVVEEVDDASASGSLMAAQVGDETLLATIQVVGNSAPMMDLFEVYETNASCEGVKMRLHNDDAAVEGSVLTYVTVHQANQIEELGALLATDVAVHDRVIVADSYDGQLVLASEGNTDIVVESSTALNVKSLEVALVGDGIVQLSTPSVYVTNGIDLAVAGDGAIALSTDSIKTETLDVAVTEHGAIYFDTQSLVTRNLSVAVVDHAEVTMTDLYASGSCDQEDIEAVGDGKVYLGQIQAKEVDVAVWGSANDVIVQATDKLSASTSLTATVYYYGDKPREIETSQWQFWRPTSWIVKPVTANKAMVYNRHLLPASEAVGVAVRTVRAEASDEPTVKVISYGDEQVGSEWEMKTVDTLVQATDEYSAPMISGVGIIAAVALVSLLAVVAVRQFRYDRRGEYTPLL